MTSFFGGLTGSVDIEIILDKKINAKVFKYRNKKGERCKLPVYEGNDDISGVIQLNLKDTKKYEHLGCKVSLIGYLGTFFYLRKKFIAIKICVHNFTLLQKNFNQLEF